MIAREDVLVLAATVGLPVDEQRLGLDFASCSGHKCFAGTGAGVLWIHPRNHAAIVPVFAVEDRSAHAIPTHAVGQARVDCVAGLPPVFGPH